MNAPLSDSLPGPVVLRGAGEMATGVAVALRRAGFRRLVLLETPWPRAVRRRVAFSEAVFEGEATVDGIRARRIDSPSGCAACWEGGEIPLLVDPGMETLGSLFPAVLVDATLRKQVADFRIDLAPVTIALGPGFVAGRDCHAVVETHRGATLGKVIRSGSALDDTGLPATVLGISSGRVLKHPVGGTFRTGRSIGDRVVAGERIAEVVAGDGKATPVIAAIDGLLRGLLRDGTSVEPGEKLGDIEPREDASLLDRVSDKALRIGEGALEAIAALATERLAR